MKHLRDVWTDLVEKRLWPVALLLVGALVAVPILLGSGADDEAGAPVAPATSSAAAALPAPAVKLAEAAGGSTSRAGKSRDPFRKAPQPAPTSGDLAAVPTSSAPAGSGGGSAGTPAAQPAPSLPRAPAPDRATRRTRVPETRRPTGLFDTGRVVNLRFGETGSVKARDGVDRLSPLPSAQSPFFVFEGILRGTRTARFLVSDRVTATGDGTCRPAKATCERIDLRVGETEYFDLDLGDGTTRQYQLDVLSARRDVASAARVRSRSARSVYRTRVRFGARTASRAHGIARLAALGGRTTPAVQYLGVGSDRRSAVFVLGPEAVLLSRNACLDGDACRAIALARDDRATVEVRPAGRPWRRYHLQVAGVLPSVAPTRRGALRARRASAAGGRTVLRRMIADRRTAAAVGRFAFSERRGTVSRRHADR